MTQFIEFATDDGSTFLVETEEKTLGLRVGSKKQVSWRKGSPKHRRSLRGRWIR